MTSHGSGAADVSRDQDGDVIMNSGTQAAMDNASSSTGTRSTVNVSVPQENVYNMPSQGPISDEDFENTSAEAMRKAEEKKKKRNESDSRKSSRERDEAKMAEEGC